MGDESSIVWSVLFGSVGIGYFIYGKKQKMIMPLVCGMGLMVYPYFFTSAAALVGIGLALLAAPWFVKY